MLLYKKCVANSKVRSFFGGCRLCHILLKTSLKVLLICISKYYGRAISRKTVMAVFKMILTTLLFPTRN